MHQRDETGHLTVRLQIGKSVREKMKGDCSHSGGGGLVGTASDYYRKSYLQLYPTPRTYVNDGVSPTTKARILQKSTIDQMFTSQIADWETKYASVGYPISRPDLASISFREDVPVTDP
ncbi:MAG: hypothetical protein M1827_007449 [Pycnora praestabilis]|nr:MAG: hypothetical protein M1827_007449 [Pycnora praestabilis]